MTATTIIDRCVSSHAVGIVSSRPYSAFFDTTAATHHSFSMEAAEPTAQMPTGMLFLWGGIADCLVY
jgi:hypothetical protein